MNMCRLVSLGLMMLFAVETVFGGGPQRRSPDGAPLGLDTGAPLALHIESGPLGGAYDNAAMKALLRDAMAVWNAVPGSRLVFVEGEGLPQDIGDLGTTLGLLETGRNLVVFDSDGSLMAFLGLSDETDVLAMPWGFDGAHYGHCVAIFNGPALANRSEAEVRATAIRALGGCAGLDAANINGDLIAHGPAHWRFGAPPPDAAAAMYPGSSAAALHLDDVSSLLALYGETPQGAPGRGSISGRVFLPDGVSPAGGVMVAARSLAGGDAAFTQAAATIAAPDTGAYRIVGLPPGDFAVEVADPAAGNGIVFGSPIRTNRAALPSEFLALDDFRPKILGRFPGSPELYNGANESADPFGDDPAELTPVTVVADMATTGIDLAFNRDPAEETTRLLYPWVSNRTDQFESVLIANNYSDCRIRVALTAIRNAAERETTVREIPAGGFLEESAAKLFPNLGPGPGYAVLLTAPTARIRGRWVTNSLQAASGASPSQGVAVRVPDGETVSERVGGRLVFGYLPATDDLISAPVLVNLGEQTAAATLRFFNEAGENVGVTTVDLAPLTPLARVLGDFLPGQVEDVYLIAEADGAPLTGVSFVFDPVYFETAIGNASALGESSAENGKTLVYPWISDRPGVFESVLVANNWGDETVEAALTARRGDGATLTATRTIPAHGFLNERASSLFPELGREGGYTVILESSHSAVNGQWTTYNLSAASGRSPAQGVAVEAPPPQSGERAGRQIMLGYLPNSGTLASAAVIVNLGDAPTNATLHFYDRLGNLIAEDDAQLRNLPPRQPFAVLADELLPAFSESAYLTASSTEAPLAGVVFVFDGRFFEPAIGNGSAIVAPEPTPAVTAFVNVTVIPMDGERTLSGHTVVTRDGVIVAVGPTEETTVPDDAVVVDGSGRFLTPGLTDTHTHVAAAGDLVMHLANGVTTILNMGDAAFEMPWLRDLVRDGAIPGPAIYSANFFRGVEDESEPHLTVATPEQARIMARHTKQAGYDFIKLYDGIDGAVFEAVMDEAKRQNMPVIGHIPAGPGLETALANGQVMIAHAEEYLNDYFNLSIDPSRVPEAARITRDWGAYVTATLSTVESVTIFGGGNQAGYAELLQRPGIEYMNPKRIEMWNLRFAINTVNGQAFAQQVAFMKDYIRDFHQAGVPILLGTDSPTIPGQVSGFSIHEEMRMLAEAGLSPYDILAAGTRVAGEFLGAAPGSDRFGVVAPGFRADLMLLEANPLEDTANMQRRVGVMARGQWFPEATLQAMLAEVAAHYQENPDAGPPVEARSCH